MRLPAAASVLLVLALVACDAVDPAPPDAGYVVEAYLEASEMLPQVRVSRTAAVGVPYDFERLAVTNARVTIHLLDAAGTAERTYPYRDIPEQPGVYRPARFGHVMPSRTYALEVVLENEARTITARTRVPALIRLGGVNADTVVYQSTDQFVLRIRRDEQRERQGYFIFATEAMDARVEHLTPFARDLYDRGNVSLDELRQGASPILNEANYDVEDDSTLAIRFPWLAVLFYGPNRVTANALDDNLYDLIRTQSVQRGGSTLSPGEIPNILEHIDGGTGIFGSFARASFDIYVRRNDGAL